MLLMFAVSSPHFVTRARTSTSHLVALGWLICEPVMTKGPTLTCSVKLRRSHSWIEERKRNWQPLFQFRSNSGGFPGQLTSLRDFIVNGLVALVRVPFSALLVPISVGAGSPIPVLGRYDRVHRAQFLRVVRRERESVCVSVGEAECQRRSERRTHFLLRERGVPGWHALLWAEVALAVTSIRRPSRVRGSRPFWGSTHAGTSRGIRAWDPCIGPRGKEGPRRPVAGRPAHDIADVPAEDALARSFARANVLRHGDAAQRGKRDESEEAKSARSVGG